MRQFALLLPLLSLASCSSSSPALSRVTHVSSEDDPSFSMASTEASSTSVSSFSQSSLPDVSASELTEENYTLIPEYYAKAMLNTPYYRSVTKGSTKAKVFVIETDQSIDVTTIKGEYSYVRNESHSSFVNTVHTAYFHDGKACYANNGSSEYAVEPLSPYLDIYGVDSFDGSIEGLDHHDGGLLRVTKLSDGANRFRLDYDPEKATTNVRIQMKAFGGLDDYPYFSSISLTLTLHEDFRPVRIELESYYKAKKIVESDCHQTYEVNYEYADIGFDIPELEDIRARYDF